MGMFLLSLSRLSTRWMGPDRSVRFFKRCGQLVPRRSAKKLSAAVVAQHALSGLGYVPMKIECLEQSLAVWYSLNRHGYPAELKIGMRLTPLSGHAWVVCEDTVFVHTSGLEDFTVVASYPAWNVTDTQPENTVSAP